MLISPAYAQGTPALGGGLDGIILMVGMFVLMWFLMIRPQMKRAKEHRSMVDALQKGDEVVTNGGLLGKIVQSGESFVKVELTQGVEVWVQRQAINAVMPKGTLKDL